MMDDNIPNIITSGHSCHFTQDGVRVELCIYCIEGSNEWSLEVVNDQGTSIVWEEIFATDDQAHAAFLQTLEEEGMSAFSDSGNVIPFAPPK